VERSALASQKGSHEEAQGSLIDRCPGLLYGPRMSNIITELGTQPPAGTIILLQVGTLDVGEATIWNVTGWYSTAAAEQRDPQALQAALARFPQGFEVAYSTSSDDLASAAHSTLAMSLYFGCPDTLRVLLPGDPLETRLPDLNAVLQSQNGQQGTFLTQPAVVPTQTLGWFLQHIMQLAGVAAPPAPVVEVAPPVPAPVPEPVGIQLSPGVVAPVELVAPPENGVTPIKKKKTTTRRKKATPSA
jgi:hypothetical protein